MQKFRVTYFGIFVNWSGVFKNRPGARNLWIQCYFLIQEKELWEMNAFEKLEAAAKKKDEMRGGTEGSRIGSRPDQESNWSAFRFGWSTIQMCGSFN